MPALANAVDIAPKPAPIVLGADVRRFELPDLDRHAAWFMPRFLQQFSHLNERQAINFLRSVLYNNEYLFLFQEKGVALAQAVSSHALEATPVVWERFVWVADRENAAQVEAASFFYNRFVDWAKHKGFPIVNVEINTDVGHDLIQKQTGRILATEVKYAQVR